MSDTATIVSILCTDIPPTYPQLLSSFIQQHHQMSALCDFALFAISVKAELIFIELFGEVTVLFNEHQNDHSPAQQEQQRLDVDTLLALFPHITTTTTTKAPPPPPPTTTTTEGNSETSTSLSSPPLQQQQHSILSTPGLREALLSHIDTTTNARQATHMTLLEVLTCLFDYITSGKYQQHVSSHSQHTSVTTSSVMSATTTPTAPGAGSVRK